jgi:outer membrane immunogenic protein
MKKLLLATVAVSALAAAAPAGAADLRMPVKALPPPPPPCAYFGGVYVGIQGGSVYYQNTHNDLDYFWNGGSTTSTDLDWHGGVQGGFNWQTGCTVWGVMADWSWSGAEANTLLRDGPFPFAPTFAIEHELKWFGTLRARSGVVVNNLLICVSGGFAWAKFDRNVAFNTFDGFASFASSFDENTRWGWAAGAGTEWSITPNLSFMGEFVVMGFDKQESNFIDAFANSWRVDNHDLLLVSRVGLNYRFGGGPY